MAINLRKREPSPEITVVEGAIQKGRHIGLGGDVAKRLARMAKRSAPITHKEGNCRFDDFVLRVVASKVVSVSRLN